MMSRALAVMDRELGSFPILALAAQNKKGTNKGNAD